MEFFIIFWKFSILEKFLNKWAHCRTGTGTTVIAATGRKDKQYCNQQTNKNPHHKTFVYELANKSVKVDISRAMSNQTIGSSSVGKHNHGLIPLLHSRFILSSNKLAWHHEHRLFRAWNRIGNTVGAHLFSNRMAPLWDF